MMIDGRYFSPDSGYFTVRGDKCYWDDGDVTENSDSVAYRAMPVDITVDVTTIS